MLAGLAHDQRLVRKAGWAEARKRAIQRGVASYKTPYGYERNGDGRLHQHPEQAETVRLIFKLKGEGKQLAVIERALEGTPSPTGGEKWSHSTLRQVVANMVYLGELRHRDFVNREPHEPLIDATTFELAQAVKPRRELKRGKLPRSAETISASLARCEACGHTLKVIPGYRGRLTLHCKLVATSIQSVVGTLATLAGCAAPGALELASRARSLAGAWPRSYVIQALHNLAGLDERSNPFPFAWP